MARIPYGDQPHKSMASCCDHQQNHITLSMITLLLVMLVMFTSLYCCILLATQLLLLLLNVAGSCTNVAAAVSQESVTWALIQYKGVIVPV